MDINTIYMAKVRTEWTREHKSLFIDRWVSLVPNQLVQRSHRLQQLFPFPEQFPKVTTHQVFIFQNEEECRNETVKPLYESRNTDLRAMRPAVVVLKDKDVINSLKTTGSLNARKLKVTMIRKTQNLQKET